MGAAVIAVVFVAGLFGGPSLISHAGHHDQPQPQVASVQPQVDTVQQLASVQVPRAVAVDTAHP